MRRRAIIPFLCAGALMLAAAPGLARVGVVVGVATPSPVVEPAAPPVPGPGYVWQPSYWSWNGVQQVWVPGTYVVAPYVHAVWVPGALDQAWPRLGVVGGHWRHWRR